MVAAVNVREAIEDGVTTWTVGLEEVLEQYAPRSLEDMKVIEAGFRDVVAREGARVLGKPQAERRVAVHNAAAAYLDALISKGDLIPRRLPARTGQQARLFDASGEFETSDSLTVFLYHLMRDNLPAGTVAQAVREATENLKGRTTLTNGFLGQYAAFLAGELRGYRHSRPNPKVAKNGYSVEIREVATGETVTRSYSSAWVSESDPADAPGDGSLFWWTDGNFGCAANRSLEFWRGKGLSEPEVLRREAKCSCQEEKQPYLVRITLPDGKVVLDEFDSAPTPEAKKQADAVATPPAAEDAPDMTPTLGPGPHQEHYDCPCAQCVGRWGAR